MKQRSKEIDLGVIAKTFKRTILLRSGKKASRGEDGKIIEVDSENTENDSDFVPDLELKAPEIPAPDKENLG